MKPRQAPWKWLLLGLIAFLLAGIALLPRKVGSSSQIHDRVTSALAAWTGGEVKLNGPIRVHYFPSITIKGPFELTDAARLPLVKSIKARDAKITLNLPDLLLGRIRFDTIRLTKAEITLREPPPPLKPAYHTPQERVANLLAGSPINVLRLRDAEIHLPAAYGGATITDFDARFDASSGRGTMSSFGSFDFRGEGIHFAIDTGEPSDTPEGASMPVSANFTSAQFTAMLTGTAALGDGIELDGDMTASIGDGRRFLRWAGVAVPAGTSLQAISAKGGVHWNGNTLTFDDGSFALDGNEADGLLAITAGAVPRIEGTLAFDRLVLDPYLQGNGDQAGTPDLFGWALLKYLDADLRISAGEIVASGTSIGRGGFTISAKQGQVAGEIGEIALCDGSASGRLSLDLSQPDVKLRLFASLSGVTVETCLRPFDLSIPLSGVATLKTELSTDGTTLETLVNGLSGNLTINSQTGAVPVDFARILTTPSPLDGEGWSRDNLTAFDTLDADCRLVAGHISCQMLNMQTPRGLVSGSGDIDLGQQTLDFNLSVANRVVPMKASQVTAGPTPRVSIRGPLSQPLIRRADRLTLGEGAPRAAPDAALSQH
ncbi:AsmA family protein [Methyloceanibacter sp.]|uniref:AsmA family protein n=1 Tax=Methyloceanibacter sp. TaxID=1965321 RepID=UPI002D26B2F1|nr:AsmA family protein [Methyloceanibacter sp.]HZP10304.1 AsmA family protein [Methyloceanibacter sp.]